jgi:ATP-dependent Clp protease ATP-binding subunit ClpA
MPSTVPGSTPSEGDGSERFARFTDRARQSLARGQEEARRLGHDYIGTEHLLLGLLAVVDGVAAKVLSGLGVSLDHTRKSVEQVVGQGSASSEGEMRLTARSKHVLELASEEAKALLHSYVGTEHLLLAILREGEGVGADVLRQRGVTYDAARTQVAAVLKKDNVVTCRVADRELEAIDVLVEAGICSTRSEAAAWLIRAGVGASQPLFDKVRLTIAEIRRLRKEAQAAAEGK